MHIRCNETNKVKEFVDSNKPAVAKKKPTAKKSKKAKKSTK